MAMAKAFKSLCDTLHSHENEISSLTAVTSRPIIFEQRTSGNLRKFDSPHAIESQTFFSEFTLYAIMSGIFRSPMEMSNYRADRIEIK